MTMMATVWNAGIICSDQVDSICRQIAAAADAFATQRSHLVMTMMKIMVNMMTFMVTLIWLVTMMTIIVTMKFGDTQL